MPHMPDDEKSADIWLSFRQMFKEGADLCHRTSTTVTLSDAMTYQQRTRGAQQQSSVFLLYLLQSDIGRAPISSD